MKNFLLLALLLAVFTASSQTLTKGKANTPRKVDTTQYAKALQKITAEYDQGKLAALYSIFSTRRNLEKQEAIAYALVNNLPIQKYNEDGTFDELQRIGPNGTLLYYSLHNVNAAISTRANHLNTGGTLGLNVNGDGLTAHVWDGGPARPTHQEFDGPGGTNRVSINDGVTAINGNSFHAQHVTGTIVASGLVAAAKGMAWQADAKTHDWNNDLAEATAEASAGMLISNHSYGYNATAIPDAWFGQYGQDAREWDQLMYSAPYYLMVNSAGNDGANNTANAIPLNGQSAYDKLNGTATAKNNFVIANGQDANVDANGNLISVTRNSGSSEGPTDDYRIKPDIMGNGTSLYSSLETSDSAYGNLTGTSMSAPNVSGSLLLLQDHYFDLNATFMRAATLKGLALHTADDVAPTGPDANTGWGQMNTKAAAEAITAAPTGAVISELTLNQGQSYQVTIQSDGVNPLKASISWTDPAGAVNNGTNSNTPALVNDLDLRLSNGTVYTPWRLTGVTTNGFGDNTVDPYERIDIAGASGQYTLTVTHKGTLSSGSQNFSLIVTGGIIAAASPEISFGTTTATTTEQTDCSFTDVSIPVNIAMAPSQDADVTFTVSGGTATSGADFDLITTSLTFLQGQTTSQDMIVRVYHDGFVEVPETLTVDFTVNPNGGDATANTNADSVTITIHDDDLVPASTQNINVYSEDFEDWTGWTNLDRDGDGNGFLSLSFTSGGYTGFTGQFAASETDLTVLNPSANPPKATANNYLISPQITIPAGTTNTAFTFSVAGFNTIEHYRLQWTTSIASYAAIDAGIILEERDATANTGDIRTVNNTSLAGQTGYFVIRHYNSSANNGILLFDALDVVATVESPIQTAVNTATTNDLVLVPGMGTLYGADAGSGAIMMSITNNNTHNYGCVDMSVSRAGTGAQAYNGSTIPNLVMDKTFDINPATTTGAGDTSITFYFTEAEIAGWETAVGGTVGVTRNNLVAARGNASSFTETATLTVGAFGSNVTLTGNFTGLDGTYYFGPIGAFVNCPGVTKTWNGSTWSPVGVPTTSNPVILSGNYDTALHGDLSACTLIVNNGVFLTVSPNDFLQVNGNITVNGDMDVLHTGSVVQVDPAATVTNNGTIEVYLTTPVLQTRDFMVMGSPMSAETRNGVFNSAFLVLDHTPGNFVPHTGVPAGGTNFADDNGDFWNSYNGVINVGEGYIVRPQSGYTDPANQTYSFVYDQGTLNNGDVTRTVTYNGTGINPDGTPNALANPYPSAISGDDLINNNPFINELYFWEHLTPPSSSIPGYGSINFSMGDISMYTPGGALPAANDPGTSTTPNGIVATGQGFGIKVNGGANPGTGSVTFTNAMRLTTGNTTLRTPLADVEKVLLRVRNDAYNIGSYALVGFNPMASNGLDQGYDTNRMATAISLYSHLDDGSEQLGIQNRGVFESTVKVPMGFATQVEAETNFVISLANVEGPQVSQGAIYLVDTFENTVTDLTVSEYTFSSIKGTFNERFRLQFEPEVILETPDVVLETISIYPNPVRDILTILSPRTPVLAVEIVDVTGRRVQKIQYNQSANYTLDVSSLRSAMYFIAITTEHGTVTKRIIKE
ncbi:S8 family serine peptidase [Altibacter sp.]|uniref:S8 family serine peptidase n=1 Tax=Altibacter sp. TaxID=2024823 RepID=UPI000C9032E1|nr:S8 family serine peptidase [Altibacter sp.]MAP54295.1 hypothetical protein [Altibacter sp.]